MEKTGVTISRLYICFITAIVSVFIFPCYGQAYINKAIPVIRLSGLDRYETSAAISREGWKTSEYVVLAAGDGDDKFADALAGSPIAYALNAPILLTPANELKQSVMDEISRLKSSKAILLGGMGAISENVERQLKNKGLVIERIWGSDRYETAVRIAERVNGLKPFTKVFITTGQEFQYAMMIAPYASRNNIPILFSDKASLGKPVQEALKKWRIGEADIIGDTNVIHQNVEDALKAMGIKTKRTLGTNISSTNIDIINSYKMGTSNIMAARDDLFADGLAGAPFAALKNMHIILVGQTSAGSTISDFLNKSTLDSAYVLGSPGAVSDYIIPLLRKGVTDSPVYGNTPANINSGGLATVNDGFIYYHSADNGGKLYKSKDGGTERLELCSDIAANINVAGDWVYYTNLTDNSNVYKIKTDGTGRVRLNNDNSSNVTVIDNWVYYVNQSDKGCLYKMASDGSHRVKLNEHNTKYLNAMWNWIYYVNADDNYSIYRIKTDDPSVIQRLKSVHAWDINVTDKFIYFSNQKDGRNLYRINIDGTEMVKLSIDIPHDIQSFGDRIYYSDASDNNKLYKARPDGTGKTVIYDKSAYLINTVGDFIYFSGDKEGVKLNRIKTDGTEFQEMGSSKVNKYIISTRETLTEKIKFDEGKAEWVDVIKPIPETEGVPVRDAFNDDGKKVAFLTFDDGPSRNVTPAILDILKENNIKATFFVTGSMASSNKEIITRIFEDGHTIANHSYSHSYGYLYDSLQNFMGEVRTCDSVLKSILGEKFETKIFRFPGGSFGNNHPWYKAALSENGYDYINWNISTGDSEYNGVPASQLLANVRDTSYGKDHIVVLMHDLGTKYTTVQALPDIIECLKSQGYQFKKLIR